MEKITFIILGFEYPFVDGKNSSIFQLINFLSTFNSITILCTSNTTGQRLERLFKKNVHVKSFGKGSVAFLRLCKYLIAKGRDDVFIARSYGNNSFLNLRICFTLSYIVRKVLKRKFVFAPWGGPSSFIAKGQFNALMSPSGQRSYHVLPPMHAQKVNRNVLERKLKSKEKKGLFAVGIMDFDEKNVAYLLHERGFQKLIEASKFIRAVKFVTAIPALDHEKNRIKLMKIIRERGGKTEKFEFMGKITDINRLMDKVNFFVLPMEIKNEHWFPISLIEAMGSNIPVIFNSSRCTSFFDKELEKMLTGARNMQNLVSAIAYLQDIKHYRSAIKKQRMVLKRHFSSEKNKAEFKRMMRALHANYRV